jgi:hypothetical protein
LWSELDRAAFGFEIGEQVLGGGANANTLDELVSGRAVEARFGAPPASLGKEHPVWEHLAEIVAVGLHNTIAYWSPERIVVGGSMMGEAGIPLERVNVYLERVKRVNPGAAGDCVCISWRSWRIVGRARLFAGAFKVTQADRPRAWKEKRTRRSIRSQSLEEGAGWSILMSLPHAPSVSGKGRQSRCVSRFAQKIE